MVARPKTIAKPSSPMVARLKNHRGQWLIDQKPLKNHWYQWFLPNHSFNGNGDPENHWCFTMVAITVQKLLPWEIKQTNHHINKIYQICFFPYTQFNFTSLFRIFGILDFFWVIQASLLISANLSKPHWLTWKYTFWVPISSGKGTHFTQKWVPILTNLGPHFDEFRSPFWRV